MSEPGTNKYNIICLNDTSMVEDFEKSKKEIIDAFESILPDKSGFGASALRYRLQHPVPTQMPKYKDKIFQNT